jgi:hypothetical protein
MKTTLECSEPHQGLEIDVKRVDHASSSFLGEAHGGRSAIDLKELSSGIYGYKIACSNFKQTGKVVKL